MHLDWVSLGAALLGELALLLVLDVAGGLWPAAWVVAFGAQLIVVLVLGRGLTRSRSDLGPANMVTLTRATLTCAVAGIAVQSLADPAPRQAVILLAGPALALDAVDGWLARRTRSETPLGARFDMETDAFLFLALSGYVARDVGWWVLLIGLARYMLLGAQGIWPVLRGPVAPRRWRKVVAATQGVVLLVAASGMLPRPMSMATLVGALVLLMASFAGEVRERMAGQSRATDWSSPTPVRPHLIPWSRVGDGGR